MAHLVAILPSDHDAFSRYQPGRVLMSADRPDEAHEHGLVGRVQQAHRADLGGELIPDLPVPLIEPVRRLRVCQPGHGLDGEPHLCAVAIAVPDSEARPLSAADVAAHFGIDDDRLAELGW